MVQKGMDDLPVEANSLASFPPAIELSVIPMSVRLSTDAMSCGLASIT